MSKYEAYPKWKYAKPASEIDKPRSVIVANADQEAALDGDWYDSPDYTNDDPKRDKEDVRNPVPPGYVYQAYPKWLYSSAVAGGKLVYNQGEEDALADAYPGVTWLNSPETFETPQIKAWGLPEDTGLNPNDPMAASDPVKLDDGNLKPPPPENILTEGEVTEPEAKKSVATNRAAVKAEGEDKATKTTDNKVVDEDLL